MTLDFAFSQEGKLKAGEMSLPAIHEEPERVPSSPSSDSSTTTTSCRSETLAERTLPSSLMDAFEVSFELRGIGWQFGRDVHVVRETRPLQRHAFLRANVECLFKNYLVLDICLATFKLLPGVGTTFGGSMYYASLPLMYRYAVALAITALSGFTLISGFHVFNSIATLIGVGLLHQSPAQWPPIIDNPWSADSLHDFWTKRWHQALRRTFLVFGGIPGSWVAGRPGLVLGAFLASGLYHEVGTYMIGRGVDHRVTLFFFLQGVGVLLEKAYRWSTGHRLGGPLGRVWTYLFVVGLGQMACRCLSFIARVLPLVKTLFLVDSWFRRGLAGGIIIPPSISPSTNFLIPLIRRMIGWQPGQESRLSYVRLRLPIWHTDIDLPFLSRLIIFDVLSISHFLIYISNVDMLTLNSLSFITGNLSGLVPGWFWCVLLMPSLFRGCLSGPGSLTR